LLVLREVGRSQALLEVSCGVEHFWMCPGDVKSFTIPKTPKLREP
jgi:hypothetical protein